MVNFSVGEKIKWIRTLRGITQPQLLDRIGRPFSRPILVAYENGAREIPDRHKAAIEAAFGLSLANPQIDQALNFLIHSKNGDC